MLHRRRFLLVTPAALVSATPLAAFACSSPPVEAPQEPADEPEAQAICARTEPDIEGPFFTHGAPSETRLAGRGDRGIRLSLRLRVQSMDCAPIDGAQVELWHADHGGAYDNEGFHFRTRVRTDRSGICEVETIVPGRYRAGGSTRPAHVHAKVQVPGRRPLTTQLYFSGDPHNANDPWFSPNRVLRMHQGQGQFDFVV